MWRALIARARAQISLLPPLPLLFFALPTAQQQQLLNVCDCVAFNILGKKKRTQKEDDLKTTGRRHRRRRATTSVYLNINFDCAARDFCLPVPDDSAHCTREWSFYFFGCISAGQKCIQGWIAANNRFHHGKMSNKCTRHHNNLSLHKSIAVFAIKFNCFFFLLTRRP